MNWKDHLRDDERQRLAELKDQDAKASKERRQIRDRCRKRAAKAAQGERP